jgi:tetratricopeptide (TPR) repeat protein
VFALALTVLLLSGAPDGGTHSAKELNVEGYELYKANKWKEAADRFKEAFTADPKLAIAHYNFAATIFRALQDDGCDQLYPLDEALEHLRTSIGLDPKRLARLKEDPDFAEFRHTARYFELLGANLASAAELTALFPKLKFKASSTSDMGPMLRVQFLENGVVSASDRVDLGTEFDWAQRTGRWRIKRVRGDAGVGVLQLELELPATKKVPALKYRGLIQLTPVELRLTGAEWLPFLSDAWAECCC